MASIFDKSWRKLYREALTEPDPTRVPALIDEASKAIQHRALELWYANSSEIKERHDLDAALYFLSLLRMVGFAEVEPSRDELAPALYH